MSKILVANQFALILLLLLPFTATIVLSPTAWVTMTAGAILGAWTLFYNRIGNFNIRPEPKAGSQLVTAGPYRYIRHPMYTTVLLLMAAFAFWGDDQIKIIYWFLLMVTLWFKSSIEEKMLAEKFTEYVPYLRTTGRFLPRLLRTRKTS